MIEIKSLYQPVLVNFPTGDRYVISGSNWIPVNDNITMDDVKWTPKYRTKKFNVYGEWTVNGSNGNTYTVKHKKGFGWWCGCKGFYYRKKCRHITDIKELNKRK
jgi:hypothetical protein